MSIFILSLKVLYVLWVALTYSRQRAVTPQKQRWLLIGGGRLQSIPKVLQEIHQSQSLVKQMLKARRRKKWKEVNREEKIYRKQTNKQISKKQNNNEKKKEINNWVIGWGLNPAPPVWCDLSLPPHCWGWLYTFPEKYLT